MSEAQPFSVNVVPTLVTNQRPGKEFTRWFKEQINAELYMTDIEVLDRYTVTEYNFTRKFTDEELTNEATRQKKLHIEAERLQKQARERTRNNQIDPDSFPCEVCGEKHPIYDCCSRCNYDNHTCHFCGDELGHSEVSACYILEGLGE
jgi:phosphorylcholine metabolism protein LicD